MRWFYAIIFVGFIAYSVENQSTEAAVVGLAIGLIVGLFALEDRINKVLSLLDDANQRKD